MSRAEDNRKAGAAAVAWKARAERAEATLASLREENDRLVKGQRNGQSASLIVAELVALVPLKDTLAASANGKTLVEYFRSVLASNEALRVALEQISVVCSDNAPSTCRHDLALKFVAEVAARALSSKQGGGE